MMQQPVYKCRGIGECLEVIEACESLEMAAASLKEVEGTSMCSSDVRISFLVLLPILTVLSLSSYTSIGMHPTRQANFFKSVNLQRKVKNKSPNLCLLMTCTKN